MNPLLKMKNASDVLVKGMVKPDSDSDREEERYTETIPEMLETINKYVSEIKV